MPNRLIALFTDFGRRDSYVAQMMGAILSINPEVRLVDLNHDVDPFDITGAAYTLESSVRFFPAGTIVVTVVDPGVGSADELPRTEHALHRLRRPARRAVPVPSRPRFGFASKSPLRPA